MSTRNWTNHGSSHIEVSTCEMSTSILSRHKPMPTFKGCRCLVGVHCSWLCQWSMGDRLSTESALCHLPNVAALTWSLLSFVQLTPNKLTWAYNSYRTFPFLFCHPRIGINWYNTTISILCCFTSVLATVTWTVNTFVLLCVSDTPYWLVWFWYLPSIITFGKGVTSHKFFFAVWRFFWWTYPWGCGCILELTNCIRCCL